VMVSLLQRVVTMVLSDGKFASESCNNGTCNDKFASDSVENGT
jgi:hypothetical protein